MIKKRFISMLVLLAAVVTGARADWTGGTYTATANENVSAISVTSNATLTINKGVTVTVNGGINATGHTLTVAGSGTLVVKGSNGNNGNNAPGYGGPGGNGGNGGNGVTGNLIVDGANVTITGGNGGNGGNGVEEEGGNGGNGGLGVSGNVTVNGGSATINGGNGGNGGQGEGGDNGSPGSSALAYSGTLTLGANVTLYEGTNASGTVLDGNTGSSRVYSGAKKQNMYAETKVVVTSITLDPATASMTLGGETLTLTPTVLPADATDKTVTWTTSDESVATVADGVVTAVAPGTATITATATNGTADTGDDVSATCAVTVSPAGYSVSLKSGTEDATSWQGKAGEGEYQALPLTGLEAGTAVTVKYNGTKKVKSVKAKKKAAAWDGTITAQLAAKLAYTRGDATDDLTTMTWAVGEHIAILYKVSGTKKVADAEITAVDGTTGAATIQFTVEDGTPDNTPCTLVYPYSAAKDDHTGVKDAATLLAAQDGTLSANLDVRVGAGTIQTTTPGLTVTTQPAAQFAIFKFTTKNSGGTANIDVTKLTITIGAQNYVITPALATSELYVALPAVADQAVRFSATGSDSKTYTCSKASVTFAARKYYQSTLKMAPPITVTWNNNDITGSGNSFSKDGVTITAGSIDFEDKSFEENGTFTTTLGNFTKIEVVANDGYCDVVGTGWSGNDKKSTWTGNASSVSFIGDIYGEGNGIKFVFTIEP